MFFYAILELGEILRSKYGVIGIFILVGFFIGIQIKISEVQKELSLREAELEETKNTLELAEEVINQTKEEISRAQIQISILSQQLKEIKTKLSEIEAKLKLPPPPKIVGEVSGEKIKELIFRVAKGGGYIGDSVNASTKEEIERFLDTIECPENLTEGGKLWYLMAMFRQWGGEGFGVGYGFGHGKIGTIGGAFRGVVVIAQEEGEYQIFWVDVSEKKLIAFKPGDLDLLAIIFI